jgi:hypothetical protein
MKDSIKRKSNLNQNSIKHTNKKPKLSQTSNETEAESKDKNKTETESKPESEVMKKPILIFFQKVTDFNLDVTANMDYD